ncbi:MCE family protein [bacterium]|nr:MCE family protein [bacterium]
MPNSSGIAVKVGIFVVVAMILLIAFSVRVSDGLFKEDRYHVVAHFDDAVGLEVGSDVSLRGVRVGKVEQMGFDTERRDVKTQLLIDKNIALPTDSVARVVRSAFLGNATIVIGYGEDTKTIAEGGEIQTETVPSLADLAENFAEISEDAKTLVKSLNEQQGDILAKIETVIDENRENIKTTSESFARVGPKMEELVARADEIASDMQGGKGTLGRLYQDDQLYEDLRGLSNSLENITAEIRDGDGTLHRLVYNDELAQKAQESFENLGKAGNEIQSLLSDQRGDLEDLIASLSDVGPKLDKAIGDIEIMTRKMNSDEGTLGLLINDPSLYQDTKRAVNQVGESFESSEEQGVIRSFLGVVFGALI